MALLKFLWVEPALAPTLWTTKLALILSSTNSKSECFVFTCIFSRIDPDFQTCQTQGTSYILPFGKWNEFLGSLVSNSNLNFSDNLLIIDAFLNVLGSIKAIVSAKIAEWLKNFNANEEFLPNGGLPITNIFLSVLDLTNRSKVK